MTIDVDERGGPAAGHPGVAGDVVAALLSHVRAAVGEAGVAQVLALAHDTRPFAALADPGTRSPVARVAALFSAAALVCDDDAVALHVGGELAAASAFVGAATVDDAVAAVADAFGRLDTTVSAEVVEAAADHAVVQVTPVTAPERHAHLCELTRGVLAALPAVAGRSEALVSEHECAARGGRACVYHLSWDEAGEGPEVADDAPVVREEVAGPVPGPVPADTRAGVGFGLGTESVGYPWGHGVHEPTIGPADGPTGVDGPVADGDAGAAAGADVPVPHRGERTDGLTSHSFVDGPRATGPVDGSETDGADGTDDADDTDGTDHMDGGAPGPRADGADDGTDDPDGTEPSVVAAARAVVEAAERTVDPAPGPDEDVDGRDQHPGAPSVVPDPAPVDPVGAHADEDDEGDEDGDEDGPAPVDGPDLIADLFAESDADDDADEDADGPEASGTFDEFDALTAAGAGERSGAVPTVRMVDHADLDPAVAGDGPHGPVAAHTDDDLEHLGNLLEGASASTVELLGDDVEPLLGEIARRAEEIITCPSYLVMVRVEPGSPIELYHRGIDPLEAPVAAAHLWKLHPDDAEGALVVDIESPHRRYGRLAAYFSAEDPCPPAEERVIRLYAAYAANLLDIYRVLSAARRSDATARALLSFSDALSQVATLAESVQLVADTVVSVTGGDAAAVYLWDAEGHRLVLRASATGAATAPAAPDRPDAVPAPEVPFGAEFVVDASPVHGGANGNANGHANGHGATNGHANGHGPTSDDPFSGLSDEELAGTFPHREVLVVGPTTGDPLLAALLARRGAARCLVVPLVAAGEFFGLVTAEVDSPAADPVDPELADRLAALADQAATALQNLDLLEKVSHMAWHDALTGLPNRRLFEDRVEQELVRSRRVGEPVCMFFVDLDDFKNINDTFGHAGGDDLIQQVAGRLVDTVRSEDTVARVGGDEFAILLPGLADQQAINQLAQRTLEALALPFIVFGEEVSTSASIGIAVAPEHGESYDDLLNRADEAMYRAKDRGRNAYQLYLVETDATVQTRRAVDDRDLYSDLLRAIDGDEFFILYQPYIDLVTSKVVGVEALIRWNHPNQGILEPPAFITLAEKSDVIVALDSWVLWQACRQLRLWGDSGLDPLRLSVNLASRDFSNVDLFERIQHTLSETGIDPGQLELEITGRVVLDLEGPARDNIERLRRLGVRFTIDDFGSGNSSLNRIGSFPVSTLKIDQSFVQALEEGGDSTSLVSAIISMADRLGLDCVAEGVENSTQSRLLLQRGCTTAQGYFFSPPLPASEITRMMATVPPADVPALPDDPE